MSTRLALSKKDLPPSGVPLNIDQVRMSWFFSSDEGVNAYLKTHAAMDVSFYSCHSQEMVATVKVDLSELANKVALQQAMRVALQPVHNDLASTLALQFVYLHINIGCIKFREVEADTFRLRRRRGLYIPSTPFITESLPPDGWDPCNEDLIKFLAKGRGFDAHPAALTMDGSLIPRSRHIQRLIQPETPLHSAGSTLSSRPSSGKYQRLFDGIAPAPIWQRKNYGELPPKHPDASTNRPPRPASAPVGQDTAIQQSGSAGRSARRALSHGVSKGSSPSVSRPASQRRPSSSPTKRPTSSPSKRLIHADPTSSQPASPSLRATSSTPTRTRTRGKRPESAPPRTGDRAFENNTTAGSATTVAGRRNSTDYQRPPDSAKQRTSTGAAVHRPSSANAKDITQLEVIERRRPSSALGNLREGLGRAWSPMGRPSMTRPPRPHSAMSAISPSLNDEYNMIDTIDELDGSEWGHGGSPVRWCDVNQDLSDPFGFSPRSLSNSSVLTGNFGGVGRRRPASAMASAGRMEETEEVNAYVLAAISRPRSAATAKTAKCVEGLRNQLPSFQLACTVSKLTDLAGMRGIRGTDILATVESSHKAWRANITHVPTLDDDLKSLDARTRLVAFRERTALRV